MSFSKEETKEDTINSTHTYA